MFWDLFHNRVRNPCRNRRAAAFTAFNIQGIFRPVYQLQALVDIINPDSGVMLCPFSPVLPAEKSRLLSDVGQDSAVHVQHMTVDKIRSVGG